MFGRDVYYVAVNDIAKFVGVSRPTARKWFKNDIIDDKYVDIEDFLAFLDSYRDGLYMKKMLIRLFGSTEVAENADSTVYASVLMLEIVNNFAFYTNFNENTVKYTLKVSEINIEIV